MHNACRNKITANKVLNYYLAHKTAPLTQLICLPIHLVTADGETTEGSTMQKKQKTERKRHRE